MPDAIFDQVANELRQLAGVSGQHGLRIRSRRNNGRGCIVRRIQIGHDFAGDASKIDDIVGPFMLDGLNPRERHQVFDKLLHATRLSLDNPQKAGAGRSIATGLGFEERFDIAQNGR